MAVQFRCSTRASGRRRSIRVVVYDDLEQLRRAATKWSRKPAEHYERAQGVTHTWDRVLLKADGTEIRHPDAGVIRLWSGRLTTEVVAHEATHMACGIYRSDCGGPDPLADMEDEEILCYLAGEITAAVTNGLYRHGLWT